MGIGFDPERLGLLMTAFLFAYGVSALVLSFAGDTWGPRKCLLVSAAAWGGLMGSAGSYASMIGARIALGAFEGRSSRCSTSSSRAGSRPASAPAPTPPSWSAARLARRSASR